MGWLSNLFGVREKPVRREPRLTDPSKITKYDEERITRETDYLRQRGRSRRRGTRRYTGRIILPTETAVAVWEHEVLGQLSDGIWENMAEIVYGRDLARGEVDDKLLIAAARHYEFWYSLKPEVSNHIGVPWRYRPKFTPRVASIGYSKKYFDLLYTDRVLRNRCIAIGRYFGKDPSYDARALRRDLNSIRSAMMSVWR